MRTYYWVSESLAASSAAADGGESGADMKMKVTLQPAKLSDLQQIRKLHLACFSKIGQTSRDVHRHSLLNGPASFCWVARNGRNVVGYVIAIRNRNSAYINWLGVNQKHRRNSIGSSLVKTAETWAKRNRLRDISLDSRNRYREAIYLYLRQGYSICGVWTGTDGDLMIKIRKRL